MGSGKTMEAAYFMLFKDVDILLMQAIFNLELHKLVQSHSESGIEVCGLKIKKKVILLGAAIAGFYKEELALIILYNTEAHLPSFWIPEWSLFVQP